MERIINIADTKKSLEGLPRPHYLTGRAKIKILGNSATFTGTALFPLNDPYIFDRKDHVNVAHTLFAIWNVGYLIGRYLLGKEEYGKFRIGTLKKGRFFRTILPDTPISLSISFSGKKGSTRLRGNLQAVFTSNDKKLAEVECNFIGFRNQKIKMH